MRTLILILANAFGFFALTSSLLLGPIHISGRIGSSLENANWSLVRLAHSTTGGSSNIKPQAYYRCKDPKTLMEATSKGTAAIPPIPDMRIATGGEGLDFFDLVSNVVKRWKDGACFYYFSLDDHEDYFVFDPPLALSQCGIVRTEEDKWKKSCEPFHIEVVRNLIKLTGRRGKCAYEYINQGDESDNVWVPVAIQWSEENGELSPKSLLKKLGAHPQLMDSILEMEYEDLDDAYDFNEDDEYEHNTFEELVKSFLDGYDSKTYFYAGDGRVNPVPIFAVARVSPTLVAGFMGGVIYT